MFKLKRLVDYEIGIYCFSTKHVLLLKRKSKDWLAQNQYNWPPWYNWNIVESGIKYHKQNPITIVAWCNGESPVQ